MSVIRFLQLLATGLFASALSAQAEAPNLKLIGSDENLTMVFEFPSNERGDLTMYVTCKEGQVPDVGFSFPSPERHVFAKNNVAYRDHLGGITGQTQFEINAGHDYVVLNDENNMIIQNSDKDLYASPEGSEKDMRNLVRLVTTPVFEIVFKKYLTTGSGSWFPLIERSYVHFHANLEKEYRDMANFRIICSRLGAI